VVDGEFVLRPAAFRALLERERALSDRSGEPFAVLVFAGQGPEAGVDMRPLVAAASTRVRATDAVGWLSSSEFGVLLRDSSVADAMGVAQEIRAQAAAADGRWPCIVHGHPPFELGPRRGREPEPTTRESPHALGQPDPR
jgi:hypothetical protein